MFLVGQRVDDVHAGHGLRKPTQVFLSERPDDRAGHPTLEIVRDVLNGFAPAKGDLGWRLDHVATELPDGDREG